MNRKNFYRLMGAVTLTSFLCGMFVGRVIGNSKQTQNQEQQPTYNIVCECNCKSEKLKYIGEFEATAYCPCEECCGKSDGITATGTIATAGRTIAVDPDIIPYGSILMINGVEYVAEDCGGAIKGHNVDIFFNTHQEAQDYGRQNVSVYIKNVS